MAGTALASLAPGPGLDGRADLWLHGGAYLILAWLLRRALAQDARARGRVLPLAIAWGYGLLLEGLQALLPYRAAEVRDLLANAAGVSIAAVLPVNLAGRTRPVRRGTLPAAAILAALAVLAHGQAPGPGTTQLGLAAPDPSGYGAARAAGARSVRLVADWSAIEPQPGQPAWAGLDGAVAAAVREGLAPVLVLAYTPRWASLGTGPDLTRPEIYSRQPPRNISDWERFVAAAVARYRDRVREWQVWTQLGLPQFRGTGAEYVVLLQAAAARIRAADPSARIAAAAPEGMDLGFVVRLLQAVPQQFDAVALAPRGVTPEALLRPLGILAPRLRAAGKALWLEWAPLPAAGEPVGALWARMHAVAQAAGVERLYVADPGRAEADLRQTAALLARRPYAGYLVRDPGAYAVVFGAGAEAVLLAWATVEGRTLDLPRAGELRVATLGGQPLALGTGDGQITVRLSASPLVIAGVPAALADEARATAAARGPLLPVVAPDREFGRSLEVFARLGRATEERGLYNLLYRTRPNGAVEPVETGDGEGVRTAVARGVVYVYFDLDDTFLFFGEGRVPLEIAVEVWGARAPRQVGFNLLYDSTGGYRFTPWQWVDASDGWVTHTVRLTDASMANTWGWDFAINAAGNRAEDLVVRTVTVRRTPAP